MVSNSGVTSTFSEAFPEIWPEVAVTVAVPGATPVAKPLALIVAIALLLVLQVNCVFPGRPSLYTPWAANCTWAPMGSDEARGVT
jgi:hypothetical protein